MRQNPNETLNSRRREKAVLTALAAFLIIRVLDKLNKNIEETGSPDVVLDETAATIMKILLVMLAGVLAIPLIPKDKKSLLMKLAYSGYTKETKSRHTIVLPTIPELEKRLNDHAEELARLPDSRARNDLMAKIKLRLDVLKEPLGTLERNIERIKQLEEEIRKFIGDTRKKLEREKKEIKSCQKKYKQYRREIEELKKNMPGVNADNPILKPSVMTINDKISEFLAALDKLEAGSEEQPPDYKDSSVNLEKQLKNITVEVNKLTEKAVDQERIFSAKEKIITILKSFYSLDLPKEATAFIESPPINPLIITTLRKKIFQAKDNIDHANSCLTALVGQVQALNGLKQNIADLISNPDPSREAINKVDTALKLYEDHVAKQVMLDACNALAILQSEKKPQRREVGTNAAEFFHKKDRKEKSKKTTLSTAASCSQQGQTFN